MYDVVEEKDGWYVLDENGAKINMKPLPSEETANQFRDALLVGRDMAQGDLKKGVPKMPMEEQMPPTLPPMAMGGGSPMGLGMANGMPGGLGQKKGMPLM